MRALLLPSALLLLHLSCDNGSDNPGEPVDEFIPIESAIHEILFTNYSWASRWQEPLALLLQDSIDLAEWNVEWSCSEGSITRLEEDPRRAVWHTPEAGPAWLAATLTRNSEVYLCRQVVELEEPEFAVSASGISAQALPGEHHLSTFLVASHRVTPVFQWGASEGDLAPEGDEATWTTFGSGWKQVWVSASDGVRTVSDTLDVFILQLPPVWLLCAPPGSSGMQMGEVRSFIADAFDPDHDALVLEAVPGPGVEVTGIDSLGLDEIGQSHWTVWYRATTVEVLHTQIILRATDGYGTVSERFDIWLNQWFE